MKSLFAAVGILIGLLMLALVYFRIAGLNPGEISPGLWLTGELVTPTPTDWTFAEKVQGSAIQTRQWFLPVLAHSVTSGRRHYKGNLYIQSLYPAGITLPDGRHWNRNLLADNHVRVKIGNKLYDGRAVYVTDPAERDAVYHLTGALHYAPGFFLHLWRILPPEAEGSALPPEMRASKESPR